jgi:hypothetical protein
MAFNLLLSTRAMRAAAGIVYFHHRGVLDGSSPATIRAARRES